MFVPLAHPPGHAQVDFGECIGVIGGVRMKLHVFCFDLPQSDACFIKAYRAEITEAFLDGHVSAFAFFGGVPLSILYENLWTPPAQGDLFGVGGVECTNLSGLLLGAIVPLALMGVRCFSPYNTIGLEGLVIDQAWKLRSLPTSHQFSPRIQLRPLA